MTGRAACSLTLDACSCSGGGGASASSASFASTSFSRAAFASAASPAAFSAVFTIAYQYDPPIAIACQMANPECRMLALQM